MKLFYNKNTLKSRIKNFFQTRKISDYPFYQINKPRLSIELVDVLCNISHNYKFAFFRIFKAANSTVVASLYHSETKTKITNLEDLQAVKDNFYYRPSTLTKPQLKSFNEDYFKFTFVRDPYERILSAYFDKVKPLGIHKHILVANSLGKSSDEQVTFDEFLFYLENGGIKTNAHWARQIDLLFIPLREFDFIGRKEKIERDLRYVLGEVFTPGQPIISISEHTTRQERIDFNLDPNTKERIWKLYEGDFETFKYFK